MAACFNHNVLAPRPNALVVFLCASAREILFFIILQTSDLMQKIIEQRIEKIRAALTEKELDALLVLVEENRIYLSGFTGEDTQCDESAGALLITPDRLVLTTDSRFVEHAQTEAPLYEIVCYKKGLAKELPALAKQLEIRNLGFESIRTTVLQLNQWKKELDGTDSQLELIPTEDLVEKLRIIKTDDEIEKTRQALTLAESVFTCVIATAEPGLRERELAWNMEKGMREAGAQELSFPTIVASGPNSALPHAVPGERHIRAGEPLLVDWGARLNGYCSDTTRTVFVGQPDEKFLEVYHTVREAHQKAITAIQAGMHVREVDSIARDYIDKQGFQGKFGHGLGHGTGLAVHEQPRLSPLADAVLEEGMLCTVEPGIYLPGWGGVRIENQVVVRKDGAESLNDLDTELICLGE
jgi:Xaa-Pro aminopeptidase